MIGKTNRLLVLGVVTTLLLGAGASCGRTSRVTADPRPNILLILADDMGYSDVGAFGGEIQTPVLDALAGEGVSLTQFHVTPNCAPTRASLLTGADFHQTGLGTMSEVAAENQKGKPGYEGFLNDDLPTLPEKLRQAGYHTYMTGKWHLGSGQPALYPSSRGFEETFVLLPGGASHWSDRKPMIPGPSARYLRNGNPVEQLPEDFYSTRDYTNSMIEFIDKHRSDGKPFFGYLAYTAPHNPLHAPAEYIDKYRGRYDVGWDALAEERFERMKQLGLIPRSTSPYPRPRWLKAWSELTASQKSERARDMEVYAAMIDYMDESIGRILDHLREIGEYDNTAVIFFSDNGASRTTILDYASLGGNVADFLNTFDNSVENRGLPNSMTDIGPAWAWAASTPFRMTKGYVSQGGIQSPCIVKLAGQSRGAGRTAAITNVTDIMSTVLEMARVESFEGDNSLLAVLRGESGQFGERELGLELYGMRAFRRGQWKVLLLPKPYGTGEWQLFNLAEDPGEVTDLAEERPDLVDELSAEWQAYSVKNGVIEPDIAVAYAKPPASGGY